MTAVVTGASGHLGANLVRALAHDGQSVRALVHRNHTPLEGLSIEVCSGDVTDPATMRSAFAGAEVVYHLAGIISLGTDVAGTMRAVNVDGAAAAATAALEAGVRRFVHCSSIHAFDTGAAGDRIDESTPRVPEGSRRHAAYDRSKADGERRVRAIVEQGLDAVIVHPTSVIGPWDFEPSRMGQVFIGLFDGGLPALVGGAFDFVDVRDVVFGLRAAAQRGSQGESYLLSGHVRSVRELATVAAQITGKRAPRITVPNRLAALGAPFIQGLARLSGSEPLYTRSSLDILRHPPQIDSSKAARDLGYAPRPLEETIRDTYRWLATAGRISGFDAGWAS